MFLSLSFSLLSSLSKIKNKINFKKANLPNLVKKTDIQVQEVERVPNKMNPKKSTPRHIIIKVLKVQSTSIFITSKLEKNQKQINLTICQVGKNHILKSSKERIHINFSYSTFSPLSLKIKQNKKPQKNCKENFNKLVVLLLIVVWM